MDTLEDWILNNKRHFNEFAVNDYVDDITSESFAIISAPSWVENMDLSNELFKDDRLEFDAYMKPFMSKLIIASHSLDSQFMLHLTSKYKEIQKSVLRSKYVHNKCNIVIADSIKILLETVRPYLDSIQDKLDIVHNSTKLSWNRSDYSRSNIIGIAKFCNVSLSLNIKNRILRAPIIRSKTIKAGMTVPDIAMMVIEDHTESLSIFLSTITNKWTRPYVLRIFDSNRSRFETMGKSGYDKMLTVMKSTDVDDIEKYSDLRICECSYVDKDKLDEMHTMMRKIKSLGLKPLDSFAVTTNGIQFKVTNLSRTLTKRLKYHDAYRLQVNVPFLKWNVKNVVNYDNAEFEINDSIYAFYTALELIGNKKQFDDKLQMAALSRM